MGTYNVPRNVKGEGRILFIFTTKSLIYSAVGVGVGLIFYLIFKLMSLTVVGIAMVVLCALIGYSIGMLKVPNIGILKATKVVGGENVDDVIKRETKFTSMMIRRKIQMTDNTSFLTIILYVMLAIMFALAVALIFIYLNMKVKEKQKEKEDSAVAESKPVKKSSSKTFNVGSVFDFMEFDKIEDNMIIQKKGARYVMVVECQGRKSWS